MTREVLGVWKKIYGNWKYVLALVLISGFFYSLSALIQNHSYRVIIENYSLLGFLGSVKFFFTLLIGFHATVYMTSFVSIILISLLSGMLFTLIFYKTRASIKHSSKKTNSFAAVGVFMGLAVPGCAACSVGLLTLIGVSAAFLGSLPFEGLELSVLAVLVLAVSVFYTSKGLLECKTCQIQLNYSQQEEN